MKRFLKTKLLAVVGLLLLLAVCFVSCGKTISVVDATINANGELILEMSDGTRQNWGKVQYENENSESSDDVAKDPF